MKEWLIKLRPAPRKLAQYFLTAGAAAVVDIGGFALLKGLGAALFPAATASFLVAALVNYVLTSTYVFSTTPTLRLFPVFMAAAGVGLSVNVGVTLTAVGLLEVAPVQAKMAGVCIAFFANFAMNANFVFPSSIQGQRRPGARKFTHVGSDSMYHRDFSSVAEATPTLRSVIVLTAHVALLIVLVVTVGLSLPTNHDETQYITSAYLSRSLTVYQDFFYSQTPYFIFPLGYWLEIAPDGASAYMTARYFNILWSIIFVIFLVATLQKITGRVAVTVLLSVLVTTSPLLDLSLRVVRNDMMPLALSVMALYLVVLAHDSRNRTYLMLAQFLTGVLLSVAACTKLSFAFVAIAFALYCLVAPSWRFRDRFVLLFMPLAIGGILAAVPMFLIIQNDFANFWYSAVTFHREAHAIYHFDGPPSLGQRLYGVWNVSNDLTLFFIGIIGLFGLAVWVRRAGTLRKVLREAGDNGVLLLSLIVAGFIFGSCLLATPLHKQYLAPVLPFVACAAACVVKETINRYLSERVSFIWYSTAFYGACAAWILFAFFGVGDGALAHVRSMTVKEHAPSTHIYRNKAWGKEKWAGDHFATASSRLRAVLGPPDQELRIATLMSQYPIDAGFGIYPELAGAPFFYHVNDVMTDEALAALRGTSPARVEDWLEQNNVRAILVGYIEDLEYGFWSYAEAHDFACYSVDLPGAYRTNAGFLLIADELALIPSDC